MATMGNSHHKFLYPGVTAPGDTQSGSDRDANIRCQDVTTRRTSEAQSSFKCNMPIERGIHNPTCSLQALIRPVTALNRGSPAATAAIPIEPGRKNMPAILKNRSGGYTGYGNGGHLDSLPGLPRPRPSPRPPSGRSPLTYAGIDAGKHTPAEPQATDES